MLSTFASAKISLAPKPKVPKELSKERASHVDDFIHTPLGEIKKAFPGASWKPSSGIWGDVESSLPYRVPHRKDIAADTAAMEPKKGEDSRYSSHHHSYNVQDAEASKVWERSEIAILPSRDAWLASNAAKEKVSQSTSCTPQAPAPPIALSWSASIPFKCYMCSASFEYSSDLSRHQVSHSPAKDSKMASGDSGYESAQDIPHHRDGQDVAIVREQVIPPIVTHSSFDISEADSNAISDSLRSRVGNAYLSVLSDEGWPGQEDSQQYHGGHLQLLGETIEKDASDLPSAESSPPLSVEVDISSSFSDEETDWGDDDSEGSFAGYSTSYFGFVDDSTGNTSNQDSIVELTLSPARQAVVDRLMKEFWTIFNAETRIAANSTRTNLFAPTNNLSPSNSSSQAGEDASQSSTSSQSHSQSNSASSRNSSISPSHEKQKRSENDRNQEEDDGRDPKRRRTLLSPPLDPKDGPKFACPYRKHAPHKYCGNIKQWRSCAMTPLTSIARVKGHLYRHHRIFPCPRCKVLFESQEEVTLHLGKPEGCEFRESKQEDGITSEMVERLRCKKKTRKGQSEEESWVEIYQLIFPGESVPSPYFEPPSTSMELSDYEEYCQRELPRVFRAALEEVVHNDTQVVEDRLRSQLEKMVRECQDRVFSSYRSGSVSRSQTPLRPMNPDTWSQHSTYAQEALLADTSRVIVGNINDNLVVSDEIGTDVDARAPKLPSPASDDSGYTSNFPGLALVLPSSGIIPTNNSSTVPAAEAEAEADARATISTSMPNPPPVPNSEAQQDHTSEIVFGQDFDNSTMLDCGFAELDLIDWNSYLSAAPDTSLS